MPPSPTSFANTLAGGKPSSRAFQRSSVGSRFREARSHSFAMAPPTAPQRRGDISPDETSSAAQSEPGALQNENVLDTVSGKPEDDTVTVLDESEASDGVSNQDEDVIEYTVEETSSSQEDDARAASHVEEEEGTANLERQLVADPRTAGKTEGTPALSAEDAWCDGQSQPRRKTASTDSVALLQRLSLCQTPPESADTIVKTGFLKKRSPNPTVGWQRRWFVLKDKRLMYFRDADDDTPAGRIDLTLVKIRIQCVWDPHEFKCGLVNTTGSTIEVPQAQGRKWMELLCCGGGKSRFYLTGRDPNDEVRCRLKPVGSTRSFELAGPYLELVDWVDKLSLVAKDCHISARHIENVSQQKGFWKIERISPRAFVRIVDTGDILLFRTKVMNAALQRAITRGTYDHVAFLLRSFEGQILILESMGDTGVILTPWDLFTKSDWFTAYQKIVLRRLRWPRTAAKLDRLLEFTKNVIGKDYELTVAKLLLRNKREKEGGYFCSELVAAAFQEIGALPASAVSSRFWPESFAGRSKLQLCHGYELEEELLVDFAISLHSERKSSRKKERLRQLKGRTLRSTVAAGKVEYRRSPEREFALTEAGVKAKRRG